MLEEKINVRRESLRHEEETLPVLDVSNRGSSVVAVVCEGGFTDVTPQAALCPALTRREGEKENDWLFLLVIF